ncbi:chemotaxis protein CheW [Leptothoe spongobia]|uniref:Chemotaxis protein CheW n=1 Tax=Leptothoe spongobia TAU-MAC 1115 TaxID=1967444 RepID=A0A947DJ04_9CYAN|nr:chemotaxis protein CheW [Leptothoe spongobia]MBT9317900.1 chemotaxis protein CheW [Leptothoe spongobia TAU-MAC 1115]
MTSTSNIQYSPQELLSLQADPLGLSPMPEDTRQRFLRFKLFGGNGVLLPLQDITEVKQLATTDILPVPEFPSSILGVCNWRGEILWLVDLNALLDDRPLWTQVPLLDQPMVIVVQSAQQSMGLVVEQVDDIELIAPESIHVQTDDLCSPTLAPYVTGYLPDHQGIVLDPVAMVGALLQGPP